MHEQFQTCRFAPISLQHGLKPDGTTTTKTRRRKGEPRVALAFDERMLAHKASLMPYPERCVLCVLLSGSG